MKTLYLECTMGAAGDMLVASLLELLPEPRKFLDKMNSLRLPGVHVEAVPAEKCGITGTHMRVTIHGEEEKTEDVPAGSTPATHCSQEEHHHHTRLQEIQEMINGLNLPAAVKKDVLAVYDLLAEAESHAHGQPVSEIHFHEVGMMDAVADITGVCLLMHMLAPDHVTASPVHVGSGEVHCAHGILPVPAPATAFLLRGIPIYGGSVQGELCTPTGAALLKYFVNDFGDMPVMQVSKIGCGMGTKDFSQANCVRAMLGEAADSKEEVLELRCNLDDMTPEALGFAQERLLAGGALDVYTTAIGMKKNRSAVLLTCLCRPEMRSEMIHLLFEYTTTLGVRETLCRRCTLSRTERAANTVYGPVHVKAATGWGVHRQKVEYEDLARIAREHGCSLTEASKLVQNNLE
ncbi:nickel pincer cofactor biosynthesis protein LarC [Caproicibacterium lactatifermentans]|jgi:hypothetical protein|uniref:Pyridinium-3,5-bisthiocarboxylic acid mononucleotide nickel insertion protein n=1 Tax=Caproicibacterium lactatifermentans TaxID=2666138 RepID=A0A859DSH4_9FIRM|nr:nickel pincer cofactor biosynthesis protein LarC [Caproicibacterium lactatifermentans]QKN24405.1 nickel pincer cofactor biosynthesis protein LarC [Caproicibacterium lactatifermentans]